MSSRSAARLASVGRRLTLKPCCGVPSASTSRPDTRADVRRLVERVGEPGDGAGRRGGVGVEEQEPRRPGGGAGGVDAAGEAEVPLQREDRARAAPRRGPGGAAVGRGVVGDNDLGLARVDGGQAALEPGAADCQLTTRTDTDGPGTSAHYSKRARRAGSPGGTTAPPASNVTRDPSMLIKTRTGAAVLRDHAGVGLRQPPHVHARGDRGRRRRGARRRPARRSSTDASAQAGNVWPIANAAKSPLSTTEKVNAFEDITSYNNFYEFGTDKATRRATPAS